MECVYEVGVVAVVGGAVRYLVVHCSSDHWHSSLGMALSVLMKVGWMGVVETRVEVMSFLNSILCLRALTNAQDTANTHAQGHGLCLVVLEKIVNSYPVGPSRRYMKTKML